MCAQAAHASLESFLLVNKVNPKIVEEWRKNGAKKIVLQASEEEILKLNEELSIPHVLIADRGLTEVLPGSITALGIGPWFEEEIDKFTRKFKLLK